jgi:hypothetical protein
MANEKHLLLTAQGDWDDSELSAEGWQVGIRLALVMGTVDDIGTLPNNWDPLATTISRTETDWTITGNWVASSGTPTFHPDDYLNDIAAPAFDTWMSALPGLWEKCRLRSLKISPIGTNGRLIPAPPYSTGTPCLLEWTGAYPTGGNGSNPLPLQAAVVASHRTNQIGRPGRGRMYIPGFTVSAMDAHGHMSSSFCDNVRNSQITLLGSLKLDSVGVDAPHVRPIVTGSGYTHYAVIDQVRVGNVMDTQRRRRRSLAETYSIGAVSY